MHFIERNISNNLHVMRPLLEAMIEARKDGCNLNTDDAGKLAKYLNLLGGMYVLDFMSEKWIKEKIKSKIDLMMKQSIAEVSDRTVKKNNEEIISGKSKIVIENIKTHQRFQISVKKNKLITRPANLIGLGLEDKIRIGKGVYVIKNIR